MALINNTQDLRKYIPSLPDSFVFDEIANQVDIADHAFLKRLLGPAFYNALDTAYNAVPSTLTADELILMPYIQRVTANMAFKQYIPFADVMINPSGGIVVPAGSTQAPASKARVQSLTDAAAQNGYFAIEQLLDYLVRNASTFPDYEGSDANIAALELFINSAAEFSQYFNIHGNHWVYWNIRPIFKRLEEDKIVGRLGQALFDEIKAEIISGTVSPPNLVLLKKYICPGLANLTISQGLDELALTVNEHGLTVYTTGTTNAQLVDQANPAPRQSIEILKENTTRVGLQKLRELDAFLLANHADYPLYESSPAYQPTQPVDITNTAGSGYYRT